MGWTSLPSGQDVSLAPGYFYAVVASVKTTHSASYIQSLLAGKGLTLINYQDPAPGQTQSGYRLVAAIVQASQTGSVPWAVPWYVPGDSSTILQAWVAPPGASAPAMPPSQVSGGSPWPWILAAAGVGGLAYLAWKRRSR